VAKKNLTATQESGLSNKEPLKVSDASLEGARLLKEWSSWMVTVELGVIALIGSGFFKDGKMLPLPVWCKIVIISFGLSIASAAHLLSGLPWVVHKMADPNRNDDPDRENFFQGAVTTEFPLRHAKVWMLCVLQHFFFYVGLLALILGIIGGLGH
jgi:hypothetical protein